MKRDLAAMAGKTYDLLIIGGGITGCAAAHDAALRGLSVAMVDKDDFGHATSSATSKLIHGGLRYLKNFEFSLVRESLRERRTMSFIAPHIVAPIPFLFPCYAGLRRDNNLTKLVMGMLLYDRLSFDKAKLDDPDRKVPRWEYFNRDGVFKVEKDVLPRDLTGAAVYYDCQMWDPNRLTLEFVLAATENGARVANYAEVVELIKDGNTIKGAVVRDRLSDQTHSINARMTVNASGPWADFVSGLLSAEARKPLVRSQGIHMITNNITNGHGLVQYTESGRFFFIIPWRDKSLIGTTDTRYEGDPDKYGVLRKDVEHFLGEVRAVYPGAKDLTLDDISWTYGGLRPIVETETSVENVNKASRKYEFYDHEVDDGIKGMMSVIGGKYTTSRALAETLVDKVTEKMGLPRPARVTRGYVLPGGRIGSWQGLVERLERGYGLSSDDARRWGRPFGAFAEDLIAAGNENADLGRRPDERQIETLAVVQRAVTEEMAMTVEDMLFRRSGMGTTGEFSAEAVETVAKHMAGLLGWDDARLADEIQTNQEKLRRRNILDFDDPAPDPHGDASLLQVT